MSNFDEIPQQDLPYTVVGHTAIPLPVLSIVLTAEGIIELAKRVQPGDRVRIKQWDDYSDEGNKKRCYGRITILRDKPKQ